MIRVGVLCRSNHSFSATIRHMIDNKCLSEKAIVSLGRNEVKTDKITFTPIILNNQLSRGRRFDLIIPESSMPHIITHERFHAESHSFARLNGE